MTTLNLTLAALISGLCAADPSPLASQPSDNPNGALKQAFRSAGENLPAPNPGLPGAPGAVAGGGTHLENAVQKAMPAVVKILVPGGVGSGFIILPSGIIATNAHVVDRQKTGDTIALLFANSEALKGTLLAKGEKGKKDIAFIRIISDKKDWKVLPMAPSAKAALGSEVVAMGFPKGLPFTVSRGIVSGIDRKNEHVSFLQTDASINPGNSGGPLITLDGNVVGMNTLIMTSGGGSDGLGFAITTEDIIQAWKQYLKIKNLDSPWLGVIVDPKLAVKQLVTGSPAKKAGVGLDDVIAGLEGKPVRSMEEFLHGLHKHMPGDTVKIAVLRGGKLTELTVVLEAEGVVEPQRIAEAERDRVPV